MRCAALCLIVGCAGGESPAPPCRIAGPPGDVTVMTGDVRTVVFHDTEGAVLSRVETGKDGVATGTIPPCGAITVAGFLQRFTVTQLQPGETIDVRGPTDRPLRSEGLAVEFPLVAGATTYLVSAGGRDRLFCGPSTTTTSPAIITVAAQCRAKDLTTAVVAYALDGAGSPLAYGILDHVDFSSGPAMLTEWRTEQLTAAVTFGPLPEPDWNGSLAVRPYVGELELSATPWVSMAPPATQVVMPPFGIMLVETFAPGMFDARGVDSLYRGHPKLPDAIVVDTSEFAPHVTSANLALTDLRRPVMSWTTARPIDDELAVALEASFGDVRWFVLAPVDQPGVLRFPLLPADLQPTMAPAQELFAATVAIIGTNAFADYAAARREPLALFMPERILDRVPLADFTYRVSAKGLFVPPFL